MKSPLLNIRAVGSIPNMGVFNFKAGNASAALIGYMERRAICYLPSFKVHPWRNDMMFNQACIEEVTLIE